MMNVTEKAKRLEDQAKIEKRRSAHREVVVSCMREAQAYGWRETTVGTRGSGTPDLVLRKKGLRTCVFEIKPAFASIQDIKRGIGQCIFYQLYDVVPYLVFSDRHKYTVLRVSEWIPTIGLVVYRDNRNFQVIQGYDIFSDTGISERKIRISAAQELLSEIPLRKTTIAREIGVSRSYISQLVGGKSCPSESIVSRLVQLKTGLSTENSD